jgi:hypothetical protein
MESNLFAKTFGTNSIDYLNTPIYDQFYQSEQPPYQTTQSVYQTTQSVYQTEQSNKASKGCFIKVKPFPSEYKELVMRNVLDNGNTSRYFSGNLSLNFSSEQGFELPLTNSWLDKLRDNEYIKYHNARQIRFVIKNNMIIGLRCKDDINYWTTEEKMMIQQLIDIASRHYKSSELSGSSYSQIYGPNYIPSSNSSYVYPSYTYVQQPISKYDGEIDVIETNFFLDKILKSIENDSEFSKLKKYSQKLKGKDGFKIILNILKQYMKLKKTNWNDIRDSVYDVKYFIRDKLLKK